MLKGFRVRNFLIYREMRTLYAADISAGSGTHADDPTDLLLVYGPNGSGKSSLVRAIAFARDLALGIGDAPDLRHRNADLVPCDGPSYFEFIVGIGDRTFSYGFEVDLGTRRLESEWLQNLDPDGDTTVFNLEHRDGTSTGADLGPGDLETLSELCIPYLGIAADDGVPEAVSMKDWLRDDLIVITDDERTTLDVGEDVADAIGSMLSRLDTGIVGVGTREIPWSSPPGTDRSTMTIDRAAGIAVITTPRGGCREIRFIHHSGAESGLGDESAGTARIVLLAALMSVPSGERTAVVDDFDRSVHRLIVRELVRSARGTEGFQMVATTHDTDLLGMPNIRIENVVVIEPVRSSGDRETDIRCMRHLRERSKDIRRDYSAGRLGGIPIFTDPVRE